MGPKRLVFDRPDERQDVKVREVVIELEEEMKWPQGMPVEVWLGVGVRSAP